MWRVQHRLEFALLQSALLAIGALPLSVRRALASILGRIAFRVSRRERQLAVLQLQAFLKLSDVEARGKAKGVFSELAKTILESLNLEPILKDASAFITIDNPSLVASVRDAKIGTVALTAHCGNWDLLAAYMVRQGIPLWTVARRARRPSLQSLLEKLRKSYGIHTVWRSDMAGVRSLRTQLLSGACIAALVDQDTRVRSVEVPFFGTPAPSPTSLLRLGIECDARIVSAFCFRTRAGRFNVFVKEYDGHSSPESILAEFHSDLEGHLRANPEQWVWFHKRWRTQNGRRMSGKEYREWLELATRSL